MRKDYDMLGEVLLPDEVYYGAQTQRTLDLFTPSKEIINQFPRFIYCVAGIKKACAKIHQELGLLTQKQGDAISLACDELIEGKWHDQLVLDMLSGNDFSPINMNFNEVIACRANEIITGVKGYDAIHPNSHVNLGQSTCDSIYNGIRLALYFEFQKVEQVVENLQKSYGNLAQKYHDSLKISHTCYQDAAPISFGQFYGAAESFLNRQHKLLVKGKEELLSHTIGYTVIGTGLGSFEGFHERIDAQLKDIFGVDFITAQNTFDDLQHTDVFVRLSALLKSTMTGISKLARDIRIMSSGPHAGFSEISIAAVQNGSSFFPGKINPSLAEFVIINSMLIQGYDLGITMATEHSEMDCQPWYPTIAVNMFLSCSCLIRSVEAFTIKCVDTILVNEELNAYKVEHSLGMGPAVSAIFGYPTATQVSRLARAKNIPIREAVVEMGLMSDEESRKVFVPSMLADYRQSGKLMRDYYNENNK